MNIDEVVARLVRGHGRVLLVCLLLPLLVVLASNVRDTPLYVSTERVQLGATVASSNVEADAVSTRAAALVQSPGFVREALRVAGARRDVDTYATDWVEVRRVGLSAVVDIAVTDTVPEVARAVASSLSDQLLAFMEKTTEQTSDDARRRLGEQADALAAQRAALVEDIRTSGQGPLTEVQRDSLVTLDQQLAAIATEISRLTTAQVTTSRPVVVDEAVLPTEPLPGALPQMLALALIVGAMLGLAVCGTLETLRPTVPSARALARLLRVPLLGRVDRLDVLHGQAVAELAERVAVAARRNDVFSVVLVPVAVAQEAVQDLASTCVLLEDRYRVVALDSGPKRRELESGRPVGAPSAAATETGGEHVRWAVTSAAHDGSAGGAVRSSGHAKPADLWKGLRGLIRRPPSEAAEGPAGLLGYGTLDVLLHQDGRRAGVVLVAPPQLRVNDLDEVRDLLDATGWPLLGVVTLQDDRRRRTSPARSQP